MTKILIPTRVRYAFSGGVSEVIRMLSAVAPDCGHTLIDLDGAPLNGKFPYKPRTPLRVLSNRLAHLRTLAFFHSEFPSASLVFFQTSLNPNSLLRDIAYMRRCSRAGRAFAVFIHGWDQRVADKYSAEQRRHRELAELLSCATRIFVLAPSFSDTLVSWGVDPRKIVVETTMVDDSILTGFDLQKKVKARRNSLGLKVLFLSRIIQEKGIYQAIEAFALHRTRFPSASFVVAGDGEELPAVKELVRRRSVEGVHFAGFVEGRQKAALLADADVFMFPTFYGEGLPISLLEAMAFGCTIITRPVGGIEPFFHAPKMGYLEAGLDPTRYAYLLDRVAENPDHWAATAKFNYEFSRANTLATKVCRRILSEATNPL
jgi:glycosyltransferase involved in cell wall biosynthesis